MILPSGAAAAVQPVRNLRERCPRHSGTPWPPPATATRIAAAQEMPERSVIVWNGDEQLDAEAGTANVAVRHAKTNVMAMVVLAAVMRTLSVWIECQSPLRNVTLREPFRQRTFQPPSPLAIGVATHFQPLKKTARPRNR